MSLCSILGYAFLSVYNLFWLVHPNVGKLESVLSGCERRSSAAVEIFTPLAVLGNKNGPEIRLDMYYDRYVSSFAVAGPVTALANWIALFVEIVSNRRGRFSIGPPLKPVMKLLFVS